MDMGPDQHANTHTSGINRLIESSQQVCWRPKYLHKLDTIQSLLCSNDGHAQTIDELRLHMQLAALKCVLCTGWHFGPSFVYGPLITLHVHLLCTVNITPAPPSDSKKATQHRHPGLAYHQPQTQKGMSPAFHVVLPTTYTRCFWFPYPTLHQDQHGNLVHELGNQLLILIQCLKTMCRMPHIGCITFMSWLTTSHLGGGLFTVRTKELAAQHHKLVLISQIFHKWTIFLHRLSLFLHIKD